MPTRKADLEKARMKAKTPYAKPSPRREPAVTQADRYDKDQKLHPAQQTGYVPPEGKKLRPETFTEG
jgi:hypothetical protein